MATDKLSSYMAVLEDLQLKRAEKELEIASLQGELAEAKRQLDGFTSSIEVLRSSAPGGRPPIGGPEPVGVRISSTAFKGEKTTLDAAIEYLGIVKRESSTRAIATGLLEHGFETASKDFYNTLFAILNREWKEGDRKIIKTEKGWTLPQWEKKTA